MTINLVFGGTAVGRVAASGLEMSSGQEEDYSSSGEEMAVVGGSGVLVGGVMR